MHRLKSRDYSNSFRKQPSSLNEGNLCRTPVKGCLDSHGGWEYLDEALFGGLTLLLAMRLTIYCYSVDWRFLSKFRQCQVLQPSLLPFHHITHHSASFIEDQARRFKMWQSDELLRKSSFFGEYGFGLRFDIVRSKVLPVSEIRLTLNRTGKRLKYVWNCKALGGTKVFHRRHAIETELVTWFCTNMYDYIQSNPVLRYGSFWWAAINLCCGGFLLLTSFQWMSAFFHLNIVAALYHMVSNIAVSAVIRLCLTAHIESCQLKSAVSNSSRIQSAMKINVL